MARVTKVEHARKDYPDHGIKKGDTYYWWQFAFGRKQMSKIPPTRQQLTQSGFLHCLYEIQDRIAGLAPETVDDLKSDVEDIISDIEALRDEQEEKRSNMPEQLQESDSGNLLQERYDELDSWASDLQSVDLDFEPDEEQTDAEQKEAEEEFLAYALSEIQSTDSGL